MGSKRKRRSDVPACSGKHVHGSQKQKEGRRWPMDRGEKGWQHHNTICTAWKCQHRGGVWKRSESGACPQEDGAWSQLRPKGTLESRMGMLLGWWASHQVSLSVGLAKGRCCRCYAAITAPHSAHTLPDPWVSRNQDSTALVSNAPSSLPPGSPSLPPSSPSKPFALQTDWPLYSLGPRFVFRYFTFILYNFMTSHKIPTKKINHFRRAPYVQSLTQFFASSKCLINSYMACEGIKKRKPEWYRSYENQILGKKRHSF